MLKHMFEYGTIHRANKKKYDLLLVLVILFTALILWGILCLTGQQGDWLTVSYDGEVLGEISLNGSDDRYYLIRYEDTELMGLTDRYVKLAELTESQAEEYISGREPMQERDFLSQQESTQEHVSKSTDFPADEDYNLFVRRKDGTVRMLAASCPDQICVNHREIKVTMDNIICLTHRLVLEINSDRDGKTEGLDGIAY